jgi:hypothetical protein
MRLMADFTVCHILGMHPIQEDNIHVRKLLELLNRVKPNDVKDNCSSCFAEHGGSDAQIG